MPAHQCGQVEAGNGAVLNRPAPVHHDAVGTVGAAQNQRGNRIAMPREAQFIELEERQIGALADRDYAQLGRPTQAAEPCVAQRSASLWLTAVTP